MYNSQLIKILKTLSKQEIKELGKYVAAPCYNARTDVSELFNYLAKHHGDTPSVFEKEKIFSMLYPNKKYDDALMRILIHQLLKIVKTYFIQKELETDETELQIVLSRAFRKRGFDDFFEKEIEIAAKMNTQNKERNAFFHFRNYLIQSEQLKYIVAKKRNHHLPYEDVSKSLIQFFTTEILRHSGEVQAYKTVIGRDIKIEFLDETIDWLEQNSFLDSQDNISTVIYYNTFKMLQTSDFQHFEKLKILIKTQNDFFSKDEINFIYSAAMNFCAKKINTGESSYLVEVFELMQTGLDNKLFFENGFLSKFIYKNIVTTGNRLEKFDWVRQFLEDYKPFLHPKDRESSYHLNLAMYYFCVKEYDNAMVSLQKSDFSDTLSALASKGLLLKIYYEMTAFDALMSLLDSFSTFILRQKDIGYLGKNYQNLIRFTRKLTHLTRGDVKEKADLREEVLQTQNVVEKEWLLEKLSV
jgi:hypothetical protein